LVLANNTIELRAVVEMLNCLPQDMIVLVSSDSPSLRLGITQWIHKWKRNGWRNAKKLDTAISLHRHVEFTWVNAHSGILLNECADQSATRGIAGDSYNEKVSATPVPEDEPESSEELEISEEEAT
jgi:ribonuclease HI